MSKIGFESAKFAREKLEIRRMQTYNQHPRITQVLMIDERD
jgi:hypothetical protein